MAAFAWAYRWFTKRDTLMANAQDYYAFFEQTPSPLALVVGPDHRYVMVNNSYRQWLLQDRDVTGKTVREVFPEAEEQGFCQILDRVYHTGASHSAHRARFNYKLKDGTLCEVYFNYIYQAIRDANGAIYGIMAMATDVSDAAADLDRVNSDNLALSAEKDNIQRLFAESRNYYIIWSGPDFIYEVSNPVSNQIVGCNPIGRKLAEVLPQTESAGVLELLRGVLHSGKSVFLSEVQVDFPEGPRFFEVNYVARKNTEGIIDGVIALGSDVSQRVRFRQRLEESEKELARAVKVAKIGFYDWDVQGDHVAMSEVFRHIYDLPSGASLETTMARIHPIDRCRVKQEVEIALHVTKNYNAQYRIVAQDGATSWLEAIGVVTDNSRGQPSNFFGTVRDISDIKRATAALLQQQHLNQSIIDQSPAGIALLVGQNNTFMSVNANWTALVSKRDYLGRTLDDVYKDIAGIEAISKSIKETYYKSQPLHLDEVKMIVPTDNGPKQTRYFSLSAFQVRDGDNQPFGIFLQANDISNTILAREALKASIEGLRRERELRESFVAALSHDMRSPLASIKLAAERLLLSKKDTASVEKFASRIIRSIDRADQMVNNLLDANRIRAGEPLRVDIMPCDIKALLRESVDDLGHLHGRTFVVEQPQHDVQALCDSEAIRRVIDNLVGNAVKYGAADAPITISLTADASEACLSVHNEGPAIGVQEQKTLFDLYSRAQSAVQSGQKGWGIGLALVKAIAQAHQGRLALASAAKSGTRFSLYLPKCDEGSATLPQENKPPQNLPHDA